MSKVLTAATLVAMFAAPAWAQTGPAQQGGAQGGQAPQTPPPAPPSGPQKASLAVMPFSFSTETLHQDGDDVKLLRQQFETSALTNKFITALVNTHKFDIIERQRVDELIGEMQMSESGLMDPSRAAKAGKMIGADFFLMGEISVFAVNVEWRRIPNTSKWSRLITAQIIVDMRIVDTRTSRIVAADRGEARQEVRSMHDAQVETVFPPDMVDTLQRQLCDALTIKTIDGVYPIRVIGFSGGVVSLNRGDGGGLEVGQTLDVFSEGQEMIDPDTGESLGSEEVKIGTIRVTEVLARFSKAVPVGGNMTLPNGSICRKVAAPQAPEAPQQPHRGPRW
jgi:curli biogenesis system outer membrane secretion channel CsgG